MAAAVGFDVTLTGAQAVMWRLVFKRIVLFIILIIKAQPCLFSFHSNKRIFLTYTYLKLVKSVELYL